MRRNNSLNVHIPPGIENSHYLVVKGMGNESYSGVAGDLILLVMIEEHKNFTRDGGNVMSEVEVSVAKAITGG
jgi:DnaJ-class molecular chaperone